MAEPTKREALGLLRRLRERADREGSLLPALAGVSTEETTVAAFNVAHEELIRACYYNVGDEASIRAERVAAIDRAIKSLEASDA